MIKNIYAFLLILTLELIFNNYISAQTGKWTQLFPKNSPLGRYEFGLAKLNEGKVLLFGGWASTDVQVNDTWIFDITTKEWTEIKTETSPIPRKGFAMSQIGDGKVLLFGGYFDYPDVYGWLDDTWLFDIETMNWKLLQPKRHPHRRDRASSAYLGNNKVLLFSGIGCPQECTDTWIYDLNKNEWDSLSYYYMKDRELAQMCELDTSKILLYGGNVNSQPHPDNYMVYLFDGKVNYWKGLKPLINNYCRDGASMAKLKQNLAMVFGGSIWVFNDPFQHNGCADDTWLFNFKDTSWIELKLEVKPECRDLHKMAQIDDGKILLFGGLKQEGIELDDTWLFEYDPTSVNEDGRGNLIDFIQKGDKIEIHLIENENYILKVRLYDYTGNIIEEYNSDNQQNVLINVANYPTGAFILQVSTPKYNWNKMFIK